VLQDFQKFETILVSERDWEQTRLLAGARRLCGDTVEKLLQEQLGRL
jgi:hypothetical protein